MFVVAIIFQISVVLPFIIILDYHEEHEKPRYTT